MSLLYYILLRCNIDYYRGVVLFMTIQWIWLILLPLIMINSSLLNLSIDQNVKSSVFLSCFILTIIFDYIFYFREIKKVEILKQYTNKYSIIENRPLSCFLTIYFALLFIGLFLIFLIPK